MSKNQKEQHPFGEELKRTKSCSIYKSQKGSSNDTYIGAKKRNRAVIFPAEKDNKTEEP